MLSIVATWVRNPNGSLPTILITSQLWLRAITAEWGEAFPSGEAWVSE
jgi:hypothetical protein